MHQRINWVLAAKLTVSITKICVLLPIVYYFCEISNCIRDDLECIGSELKKIILFFVAFTNILIFLKIQFSPCIKIIGFLDRCKPIIFSGRPKQRKSWYFKWKSILFNNWKFWLKLENFINSARLFITDFARFFFICFYCLSKLGEAIEKPKVFH